jgi:N-sulfoglucosamine sulfohydrolase
MPLKVAAAEIYSLFRMDNTAGLDSSRRGFLKSGAGGVLAASASAQQTPSKSRPNILYLHSHDTGRYVQPYGHPVPTPNLQKLAEGGVLFRQAFNAAPTCSPSRASLLTGQCPHRNGMLGLAHRGFALADYKHHMLHTLRDAAGYSSTLIGIQHIAQNPQVIGYDQILPTQTKTAQHVAPAAVNFLKNAPKQPFFLDVGFFETHREFHPPGVNEDPRYCQPPAPIPDTARARRDIAAFKASARVLDGAIGAVLTALEESGLADRTLVICTTDHGIAFPNMKCSLFDHGMGVMLTMRGPGGFTGGKVSDAMVSQIDLFPTVCELLDIVKPDWLEGRSMMPLMRGDAAEINDQIFAEVNYHAAYEPKRAVRTKRWKYIRHFDNRDRPNLPNCDDGFSKDVWLEAGWRNQPIAREQLYDLMFDPNETRNLIGDAAMQATAQTLRGTIDTWMKKTDDPLLKGGVKAPPGALANDPDETSPRTPPKPIG